MYLLTGPDSTCRHHAFWEWKEDAHGQLPSYSLQLNTNHC